MNQVERHTGKRVKRYVKYILASGLVIGATFMLSCSVYTFNPRGKSEIGSIAVERFENKTPEYGLADQMTDIVIDALIEDGTMKVLSTDMAEAILVGVLTRYERVPHKFDENDQVQQYKVVMVFDVSLTESSDKTELWHETMRQEGIYDVEGETEEDGRQEAIALLVEAIMNKTTRSW